MDDFWLKKAREYILDHHSFENVSEIKYSDKDRSATIEAIAIIGLPSKFIKLGITDTGVKEKENVEFFFPERFPLYAPKIFLRNDFPRCFPHINPSTERVNPCIYEGNTSELLQQAEWMNGILNQLIDWLEKAASNDLLNYEQGWEAMRNDNGKGIIIYETDKLVDNGSEKIFYKEYNGTVIANSAFRTDMEQAHIIYLITKDSVGKYIPNSIKDLADFYSYALSVGLQNIREKVEENDSKFIDENKLFVVLGIKRPVHLIGSETNIEHLNFVIHCNS